MAAATSTVLMGIGTLFGVGTSLYGGMKEAEAEKAQSQYQAGQLRFNSRLLDRQAGDALRRGRDEANLLRKEGKKYIGSQRASYAGQNVEIDSGSALDAELATAEAIEKDALTISNNAFREAWGYKVQAADARNSARLAEITGRRVASNTLLTGGFNAITGLAKGASDAYNNEYRFRNK